MNWKHFWNLTGNQLGSNQQVGRIKDGNPLDNDLFQKIADKIASQLNIAPTDALLDVCCGNGMLSLLLSQKCKSVTGVDFSDSLIQQAKGIGSNQLEFIVGDAQNFQLNQRYDKVLLYFSFQYFENYQMGKQVIQNLLNHTKPGAVILLGDIPDSRKFFTFYNSLKKFFGFLKQELTQTNNMGKFWNPKELHKICQELGVEGMPLEQENWQPYAHYRFDFLIKNN